MRRPLVAAALAMLMLAGCTAADEGPDAGATVVDTPAAAPARPDEPSAPARPDDEAVPRPPGAVEPGRSRDVPVTSAAGLPQAPTDDAPVRVRVPALGADVPVDPVGITADGQMEIPPDAARAGWYRFGPSAGAPEGTVVIAAHSGSHLTALGPLRDLIDLAPGDPIVVAREDGGTFTYAVESAQLIPKSTIDLGEHFRRDGQHRLVLITCDGVWQEDVQSYTDNTVVTATLITS